MPGRIPNALPRREMQSQWLRQRARWIGALVTGALAIGAMASAYAWLIEQAHRWFVGAVTGHAPIMLLLCPAVGAASVWLTRRYFAGAEGSGIPQTLAALHGGEAVRLRLLTVRLALARIGLTVLATAGGCRWGGKARRCSSAPSSCIGCAAGRPPRTRPPRARGNAGSSCSALPPALPPRSRPRLPAWPSLPSACCGGSNRACMARFSWSCW